LNAKLKNFLIYLLTAVVSFCFGLFILDQVILPQLTGVGRESVVPQLTGLYREEAESACRGAGVVLEVQGETYSSDTPAGYVLDQDPETGLTVKQGRSVYVILSKGPEIVSVPHVKGLTQRQAEILIERNFLVVDTVTTSSDQSTTRGRVIEIVPPPGTPLPKGEAVSLVVSQGTPRIRVPSLVDMTVDEAREVLTGAGLTMGELTFRYNSFMPAGKIIDQHPLERTPVEQGSRVNVVVTSSQP